jgi:hypothetical protein
MEIDSGVPWSLSANLNKKGFFDCQTPTSAVRLEIEGCRLKSEKWRVEDCEWRMEGVRLRVKNEEGDVFLEDGLVWASAALFLVHKLSLYQLQILTSGGNVKFTPKNIIMGWEGGGG